MATWTYQVSVTSSSNNYLKNGTTVSATMVRTSPSYVADLGLYKITGNCTVTSNTTVCTYAGDVTLNFGGLLWIGALAANSNVHAISETGKDVSASLLNVGTEGTAIKITAGHPGGGGNGGLLKGGCVFTISIEVGMQFDASTFTCSDQVEYGVADYLYVSNSALSLLSHAAIWQVDSTYSYTTWLAAGTTTAAFTAPLEWMNAIPAAVSDACTVTLQTYYNGTYIGQTSKTITLNVPASVKPGITSFTGTIYNDTSADAFATNNGIYLQNLCGALFEAQATSGGYGSTVTAYAFSVSTADTGTASENKYAIDKLTSSGSLVCTVTVTDSRGRSTAASAAIEVAAYTPPVITSCSASRCTEMGSGSEDGAYAMIRCAGAVTPITVDGVGKNTMTISSYYYVETSGTPAYNVLLEDMTNDKSYIAGGTLSASLTYYIRFVITDALGGTAQEDKLLTTAAYAMHIKNGGLGVAFGKTSEIANAVEINHGWDFYYRGVLMPPIVYSETDAPSNPTTGLIWLKKK